MSDVDLSAPVTPGKDHLGLFLDFADSVQANAERAHRPAYAETCACGGSVEVGRDTTRADLRRIHAHFIGRHRDCLVTLAEADRGHDRD